MDETLARRIRILQMIPRKGEGTITAPQILEKLYRLEVFDKGVTLRTIQRDLQALSLRFQIECDDGSKPHQWYWWGNEVVDIPAMGHDTALAFLLARDYLKPLLPRSALASLGSHFKRAEETLASGRTSAGRWKQKVRVIPRYFHPRPAKVPRPILQAVDQALYEERQLRIRYHSLERIRNGEPAKDYTLNPVMLAYRNSYTELLALSDHRPGALLRFALHRMKSARVLDNHRSRNPKRDWVEAEIDKRMAWPEDGNEITLRAWVAHSDAHHVLDTPLADGQETEMAEDGVIITARLPLTSALIWWILGMGAKIRVLQPPALQEKIRDIVRDMNRLYE